MDTTNQVEMINTLEDAQSALQQLTKRYQGSNEVTDATAETRAMYDVLRRLNPKLGVHSNADLRRKLQELLGQKPAEPSASTESTEKPAPKKRGRKPKAKVVEETHSAEEIRGHRVLGETLDVTSLQSPWEKLESILGTLAAGSTAIIDFDTNANAKYYYINLSRVFGKGHLDWPKLNGDYPYCAKVYGTQLRVTRQF